MNAVQLIEREDTSVLGLNLPDGLVFDEWVDIGRRLCVGQQAIQWKIGDWWAFGDHRYGVRAKAAAEGLFGASLGQLMDCGWVSRAFETSERSETVDWSSYRIVASLAKDRKADALALLDRGLPARDLRREVQAIKAANDPGDPSEPTRQRPPVLTPPEKEAVDAWVAIIELCDALEEFRPLTKRETRLRAHARNSIGDKWDGMEIPPEFDVVFVEQGRVACESWFGARRTTIDKWLIARGKLGLLRRRALFIEHLRTAKHPRQAPATPLGTAPERHERMVAGLAAKFLQHNTNGGWQVYPHPAIMGQWVRGKVTQSTEELIAFAVTKGFDRRAANLQARAEDGDN